MTVHIGTISKVDGRVCWLRRPSRNVRAGRFREGAGGAAGQAGALAYVAQ